jgi:hypothetical protein
MLELHQRVRSIMLSDSLEHSPDTPANIKGQLASSSHLTMIEFTSAASITLALRERRATVIAVI